MVSATRQTERRRELRLKAAKRRNAYKTSDRQTPAFPVHPEGYDSSAPDAKSAQKADGDAS